MTICNQDAVLVIGAGTSAPFGVPQGAKMIPNIHSGLKADREHFFSRERQFMSEIDGRVRNACRSIEDAWRHPFYTAVLSRHLNKTTDRFDDDGITRDLHRLKVIEALLDHQTSETIDDFIVENPSFRDIVKICIAAEIAKKTYNLSGNSLVPKAMETRFVGSHRNWIHLLINLIRHGIRTNNVSEQNKIRVVSFNYDGILEYVLEEQFGNTESPYRHYTDYIEILHPHGRCGLLNQEKITTTRQLSEWSSGISVVNEPDVKNADVLEARKQAKAWISKSTAVYVVGFAFSGPNCDLMGFRSRPGSLNFAPSRTLNYCNFDGSIGVTLSANRCDQFVERNPTNGSIDRPISVEDWILAGHLGELPG